MSKELKVAALCNGTVIDHLPSEQVFNVVSILKLETSLHQIFIGNNLDSKQLGTKGIIKISDKFLREDEINKIALIAPGAKINIIKDYQVVEKRQPKLPDDIHEIVRCVNPKCITNNQPVTTHFQVINNDDHILLKCHYCEREIQSNNVKLN
ncbi:MAG: aspartate carbamoyltransferase regulatory subunit [Paludibacter sp.]|nr:aspartate carbamoyltransferase regulatory subunit [Paludibacter sp.]